MARGCGYRNVCYKDHTSISSSFLASWPIHVAERLVDLLGDSPVFQHVKLAHFHSGGSLTLVQMERETDFWSWMNWRSSFSVCAELIWLIIFYTSQGRERYSGWAARTHSRLFSSSISSEYDEFFSVSCHSHLMNAFPPLHFKKWDSLCNTIHSLKITSVTYFNGGNFKAYGDGARSSF